MGGLSLKPIIAKALQMGDELHNRPNAASSIFAGAMGVPMIEAGVPTKDLTSTLSYISGHDLLFLGLAMASAKSAADAARGIEYSTVVTAMARNGYEFGINVSGLDGQWFTAPAPARYNNPPISHFRRIARPHRGYISLKYLRACSMSRPICTLR